MFNGKQQTFGAFCLDVRTLTFLPTSVLSTKPLKVEVLAGEHKGTKQPRSHFLALTTPKSPPEVFKFVKDAGKVTETELWTVRFCLTELLGKRFAEMGNGL